MPDIKLTNMCMIYKDNKVLVQDRVKSWRGISFPGGHVENGESIVESTIREIKEETGYIISDLVPCGTIYWYNDKTKDRYFVFNYKTNSFTGNLINETEEGKVYWIEVDKLRDLNLAKGFEERLPMFLEDKYIEGFGTWNSKGDSKLIFR